MEYVSDIIVKLFQNISPIDVLTEKIQCDNIDLEKIQNICFNLDYLCSESEIQKKLQTLYDRITFELYEEGVKKEQKSGIGIFELLNSFVKEIFVIKQNELVYKYKYLKEWHLVRSQLGEELVVAAAYAYYDYKNAVNRTSFLWRRILRHNNDTLNMILDRGLSDNHYHLRCSTPYFELSWLTLMNIVTRQNFINKLDKIDEERRNPQMRFQYSFRQEKYSILHLKAALLRIYLYAYLKHDRISLTTYYASVKWLLEFILEQEKPLEILDKWEERCNRKNLYDKVSSCNTIKQYLEKYMSTMSVFLYGREKNNILLYEFQKKCPMTYWFFFIQYTDIFCVHLINKEKPFSQENISYIIKIIRTNYKPIKLEECECFFDGQKKIIYEKEWNRQTREELDKLLQDDYYLQNNRRQIQNVIDSLLISNDLVKKDYALNAVGEWDKKDWEKGILSGERWILYKIMYQQYTRRGVENKDLFQLFYAYLLIKNLFRRELIQTNNKIGFENFQKYQKRKNWFTSGFTEGELAKMAVQEALNSQKLCSLELRITPSDNCDDNIKMIRRYDMAISSEKRLNEDDKKQYYYVFHFGKRQDQTIREGNNNYFRHEIYRKQLRKKTNAILLMRKINPAIAERVKGIDACSSEDGCRPEVFAVDFRVLKNHVVGKRNVLEKISQLKATYHVGEDNQDILDGLRAIDEAIFFLNLDFGDRLGHAIALGVDVEKWYANRNYTVHMRRQDYLDNIVWLYNKIIYYQISDCKNLLEFLKQQFQEYFGMIFLKQLDMDYNKKICDEASEYDKEFGNIHFTGNSYSGFDIYNYYNSWQLRGDDPSLYEKGYYRRNKNPLSIWDDYAINKNVKKEIRYVLEAGVLYHLYHFNGKIKKEGDKSTEAKISIEMVKCIAQVQKHMQKEIAKKGIAIEMNPSSNMLISSLQNYEDHPIKSLYNKSLTYDPKELKECAQLSVSINTDDVAVFSTSLYNEYTLMAYSLENAKNKEGKNQYEKHQVYDWIEAIRLMGIEQSFIDN